MCDQDGQHDAKGHPDAESDHHVAPNGRRHIGEAVALILYFAVDGFEVWPEHHGWALVIAVAGISAICFGEFPVRWWLGITVFLAALAAVIYFWAGPVLPKETETHGWLIPKNDPTPPNGCSMMQMPANALLFLAGTNGAWTTANGRSVLLNIANSDVLSVERDESGLLFDMDMHDEQGNLIFRIERNEFRLVAGTYSYRDRSADRSTIAVFDKKGEEMLYIEYANPQTVIIRGHFVAPDGTEVRIDNRGITEANYILFLENLCRGNFSGQHPGFSFSSTFIGF